MLVSLRVGYLNSTKVLLSL